jgi:hypothetical protein
MQSTTPTATCDESLGRAMQRSEGIRITLIVMVLVVSGGVVWLRRALHDSVLHNAFTPAIAILGVTAAYVVLSIVIIRRANARNTLLPSWLWAAGAVFESFIPTAAIFLLQEYSTVPRLESIAAPAILLYGVVIVASILRLRPWLSLLSGGACAVGHLGLVVMLVTVLGEQLPSHSLPFLFSYPVLLVLTGVMAALVSREVRKYVDAALREAQTRRQLDLVQSEMAVARKIQQGLMPKRSPELAGFNIAGWNRPASQTGGDYYDWQYLPDGRLAVVIADVTGHGLGPALLMAVCRAYARACMPASSELRLAIDRINAFLHDDITDGRFVTLAAAVIDPRTGSVELLSAGHGPLLLLHAASSKIEEFEGNGLPLGLFATEDYGNPVRFEMAPGDVLLLVTDGFVEWARPSDGKLYGVERLGDFLRATPPWTRPRSFNDSRRMSKGSRQAAFNLMT